MSCPLYLLTLAIAVSAVSSTLIPACDRDESKGSQASEPPAGDALASPPVGEELSPAETIRLVHKHRRSGRLSALAPHLLPEQRPHIVELIQAVDRLRWADQVLQESVARRLGESTARALDRSQLGNIIAVFSWDVAVVGEAIEGDRATVSVQIADRLPLERVEMIRRDGRWIIVTDPPIRAIAGELRKLAEALVAVARRVDETEWTLAQIERELDASQAPISRRLSSILQGDTGAAEQSHE